MESSGGIDEVLHRARARLRRFDAGETAAALVRGALVVDTRPASQRERHGEIPGSIVIDRNVLEWRLDPSSASCIPEASYEIEVVVVCQEGYSSSLAAASLQDIGVVRATDLVGGFRAWQGAGMPVAAGGSQRRESYPDAPRARRH